MLLSLTTWAARSFETPPTLATLRAWAASGRISGAVKVGRSWMVPADAEYICDPIAVDGVSDRVADILRAA